MDARRVLFLGCCPTGVPPPSNTIMKTWSPSLSHTEVKIIDNTATKVGRGGGCMTHAGRKHVEKDIAGLPSP